MRSSPIGPEPVRLINRPVETGVRVNILGLAVVVSRFQFGMCWVFVRNGALSDALPGFYPNCEEVPVFVPDQG